MWGHAGTFPDPFLDPWGEFNIIIIDLVTAACSLFLQCEATLAGKWGAGSCCAAVRRRWDVALWSASCVFGLYNLPPASCRTNNNTWLISPEPFPPLRLASCPFLHCIPLLCQSVETQAVLSAAFFINPCFALKNCCCFINSSCVYVFFFISLFGNLV